MKEPSWNPDREGIVITPEEVNSSHVDDMLKRQASLRGEGGIARSGKGKWFLQNWFIFMLAGAVGAIIAWALIEPYFDDMLYIQGTVEEVSPDATAPTEFDAEGNMVFRIQSPMRGRVTIHGETVWFFADAKLFHDGSSGGAVDLSSVKTGDEIGLYVLHDAYAQAKVAVAKFMDPQPVTPATGKATLNLQTQSARVSTASLLLFAVAAALVGLAIGMADGIVCRIPRRAVIGGIVGILIGFIGGFISNIIANVVYTPLNSLAMKSMTEAGSLSATGFLIQMGGRGLAWCLAGIAMGFGQGIALRSSRLVLYGFLGGIIGGLLGGLLFDPIDLLVLGMDKPSAHWSRLIGLAVIGASVGAMIGIVERLARDAWLRMMKGPLAGKEFLVFKDTMYLGSSPRSEIYLFNDDEVAAQHAVIRTVGGTYEIENLAAAHPTQVNERTVQRTRLRHGDQIFIGRTSFVFQVRKSR